MRISDWSSDVCSSDLLPSNTTAEKNLNALLPTQSPAAPDVSADTETFATTVVVRKPYLLFLGEATHFSQAKTSFGLRDWAPEACVGPCRLTGCQVTLGWPAMSVTQ